MTECRDFFCILCDGVDWCDENCCLRSSASNTPPPEAVEPLLVQHLPEKYDLWDEYYKNYRRDIGTISNSVADVSSVLYSSSPRTVAEAEADAANWRANAMMILEQLGSEDSEGALSDRGRAIERCDKFFIQGVALLIGAAPLLAPQRKALIDEYEIFKCAYDSGNVIDLEQMRHYREVARGDGRAVVDRARFYQLAAAYCNAAEEKARLKEEYEYFCRTHQ
jgi:hypothetical protein